MKRILATVFCIISLGMVVYGQADKVYARTLKKMFEVSGTEETYKTAITQMFTMYKQQYTEVDAEVWDEFEQEFLKTSLDDLVEMLVPVYYKYMTKEDLETLIAFYQTPAGVKFGKYTPMIMQESMQIGQEWGKKIGQEFQEKMKEKK
ncbi:MAG: DUF2059 domain-containing protein [Chitinophagales bacterium]|nr:DUF2059 domain-containing protein [Chitinophagales bacterium]